MLAEKFAPAPQNATHWRLHSAPTDARPAQMTLRVGSVWQVQWPIEELSDETILRRWGPGRYRLSWYGPDGGMSIGRGRAIVVEATADDMGASSAAPPPAVVALASPSPLPSPAPVHAIPEPRPLGAALGVDPARVATMSELERLMMLEGLQEQRHQRQEEARERAHRRELELERERRRTELELERERVRASREEREDEERRRDEREEARRRREREDEERRRRAEETALAVVDDEEDGPTDEELAELERLRAENEQLRAATGATGIVRAVGEAISHAGPSIVQAIRGDAHSPAALNGAAHAS